MKPLFFGVLLFTVMALAVEASPAMNRRIEALAIGEATLAYRLVALSASLSIAAATDNEAVLSLLENVDSTLTNGRAFLTAQDAKGPFTKELSALMDAILSCSNNVKDYTKNKSYDNLQKIRGCIDPLEGKITDLTERFNKAAPTAPAK
jgi:peptidoglycan hydrolase CwlO-like protein